MRQTGRVLKCVFSHRKIVMIEENENKANKTKRKCERRKTSKIPDQQKSVREKLKLFVTCKTKMIEKRRWKRRNKQQYWNS